MLAAPGFGPRRASRSHPEHFSSPQSFFAERLFALFDSDGSGTISLEELLSALSLLVHGSETDKLRFLFQVYDVDGKMRKKRKNHLFRRW